MNIWPRLNATISMGFDDFGNYERFEQDLVVSVILRPGIVQVPKDITELRYTIKATVYESYTNRRYQLRNPNVAVR